MVVVVLYLKWLEHFISFCLLFLLFSSFLSLFLPFRSPSCAVGRPNFLCTLPNPTLCAHVNHEPPRLYPIRRVTRAQKYEKWKRPVKKLNTHSRIIYHRAGGFLEREVMSFVPPFFLVCVRSLFQLYHSLRFCLFSSIFCMPSSAQTTPLKRDRVK